MYTSKTNVKRLWNCCAQRFGICSPSFQICLYSKAYFQPRVRLVSVSEPTKQFLRSIIYLFSRTLYWFSAAEPKNLMISFSSLGVYSYEPGPLVTQLNAWIRLLGTVPASQIWNTSIFSFSGCQTKLILPQKYQNMELMSWLLYLN